MKGPGKYAVLAVCVLFTGYAQPSLELVPAFPSLQFVSPIDIQNAGDGSNRLFVVEQAGIIKVFPNSPKTSVAAIFLDISSLVTSGGEKGLLGLAFHPEYEINGHFYVNYTRSTDSLRTYISRFSVSSSDPDSADPASEQVLLQITQPYENHNGGQIAFGSDGYLYIGLGDGGSAGDPLGNAQNLSSLLGKILRIDVNTSENDKPYGIPPDNPFAGNASGIREEIHAYGLRNPWRFSFDPVTETLWCGDVGQASREEIDTIRSGGNYGWPIMEGTLCYNAATCDQTGLELPVWDYGRSAGGSITGGFVYRGWANRSLTGKYAYGDFVSGRIWVLTNDGVNPPTNTLVDSLDPYTLTSFGVDENNELFLCTFEGNVYRIRSALKDFFPLEIGNSWAYFEEPLSRHVTQSVVSDTLVDGSTYFGIHVSEEGGGQSVSFMRVDDSSRVYEYKEEQAVLMFRLDAEVGESWPTGDSLWLVTVENSGVGYFFGSTRPFKTFVLETYPDPVVTMTRTFVERIGLYSYEGHQGTPSGLLVWAQVGDTAYGVTPSVEEALQGGIPTFDLYQNFPNPFNSSTVISYRLPRQAAVLLKVFDMYGREVGLIEQTIKPAGVYSVPWEPAHLASGVYFYRLQVSADSRIHSRTAKMLLLK